MKEVTLKAIRGMFRRDERGVAMVTVLFVGAALTVVTSTATFVTIQEFRASGDDLRSTQALAVAEAGLDRMIQTVKVTPWADLVMSGCPNEDDIEVEGIVGSGDFAAAVNQLGACPVTVPDRFEPYFLEIESVGELGGATRTIRQEIRVVDAGLPIGVFAYDFVAASGEGQGNKFDGISLITRGDVDSREKLTFTGFDPWLTQFDLYGSGPDVRCKPSVAACTVSQNLPAAVHAGGTITCDAASTCSSSGKTEHVGSPDSTAFDLACTANGNKGGASPAQSAWDGSARGGTIPAASVCAGSTLGKAPTSLFTVDDAEKLVPDPSPDKIDYAALKNAAIDEGLYCSADADDAKFICNNGAEGNTIQQDDVVGLPDDYIVYFDFTAGNPLEVNWQADVGDCEGDSTVVLVVRHGDIDINSGSVAGGIIAADLPNGTVKIGGGGFVHGTIISQTIDARGNSDFIMDECAINSLSGTNTNVTAGRWSELDRPE